MDNDTRYINSLIDVFEEKVEIQDVTINKKWMNDLNFPKETDFTDKNQYKQALINFRFKKTKELGL